MIKEVKGRFYIVVSRCGVVMKRSCKTLEEAIVIEEGLKNDIVVDLLNLRYYFQPDQILMLRKPHQSKRAASHPREPST